eukprot:1689778-Rhodomonas_salina.2
MSLKFIALAVLMRSCGCPRSSRARAASVPHVSARAAWRKWRSMSKSRTGSNTPSYACATRCPVLAYTDGSRKCPVLTKVLPGSNGSRKSSRCTGHSPPYFPSIFYEMSGADVGCERLPGTSSSTRKAISSSGGSHPRP